MGVIILIEYYPAVFLAIHDPSDMPNLKTEGMTIQPGMFYDIKVDPSLTMTDKSGLALDLNQRNCRSKDEKEDLKTFNIYSQTACIFECQLGNAMLMCNCSAWDYPVIDPSVSLCRGHIANECFHNVMSTTATPKLCHCMNDCEHVKYDIDVQVTPLRSMRKSSQLLSG